jgi:DnaJ-domain-containing protein 1
MSGFIDRLAEFLRGIMGGDETPSSDRGSSARQRFVDPDLQEAWDELNDYMNTGRETSGHRTGAGRQRTETPRYAPDESLRQDYANLEVPFGADMETVRRSYKALILRYHPDKYGKDPQKQKVALEITKKINESFERIRRGR